MMLKVGYWRAVPRCPLLRSLIFHCALSSSFLRLFSFHGLIPFPDCDVFPFQHAWLVNASGIMLHALPICRIQNRSDSVKNNDAMPVVGRICLQSELWFYEQDIEAVFWFYQTT